MRLSRLEWLPPAPLLALWPVWRWYGLRLSDGSDEPWGALALLSLVAISLVQRETPPPLGTGRAWAATLLLAVYAASYAWLPPLCHALLGVGALGLVFLRGGAGQAGRWGLLGLSLPWIASLQFYAGFPLRLLAAAGTSGLLHLVGFPVGREGTTLHWAGEAVLVDAPCSGIHMLWLGLFLACLLAAIRRLPAARAALCAGAALCIVVAANVLRAAALFFKEARLVSLPEWTHAGIGLICFAGAAWAILVLASRQSAVTVTAQSHAPAAGLWPRRLLVGIGALASLAPLLTREAHAHSTPVLAWPESFEGEPLTPVPPTTAEQRFGASFPGKVAQFTTTRHRLVLRQVTAGTRLLHSSADCFRGLGYEVEPAPAVHDAVGRTWSAFTARRPGHTLHVREQIAACASTASWSDVSAWYWAALLHPATGPWLATTVIDEE